MRKFNEMGATVRVERRSAKEGVVKLHLNTVPFWHNAFCIEGAVRTYFGTSDTRLNTFEAATLVAM